MSGQNRTLITRLFQNQFNRELKSIGVVDLPYTMMLEISPSGRLHLHGAVDTAGYDRKQIEEAMRRAGGKIQGRGRARQVKLESLYDGAGWAAYVEKVRKRTSRELGLERLTIMSQEMSRRARMWHEESRRNLYQTRTPDTPEVVVPLRKFG